MKRGPVKGETTLPSSRHCSNYPRNSLVPLSFLWFVPLAVGPCPWLSLIGLHESSIFHSRRGRVLPFPSLSVGLALSYSVKPPQPGSLGGPVTKSTAMIAIRDRGQGWQWKIHRCFDSWILKLLPCVDQPAARVWLEQGWRTLKLLPCVD